MKTAKPVHKIWPLLAGIIVTVGAFARTCWGSFYWMQANRGPASEGLSPDIRLTSMISGTLAPAFIGVAALVATFFYWHRHKRSIKRTLRSLGLRN